MPCALRERYWVANGNIWKLSNITKVPQAEEVDAVVLLHCVKPTKETLFADVPNLNINYSIEHSEDRDLLSSFNPSLHCKPLLGAVAVK